MRQTIIIDTSALVALINPNDPHHQWAVEQWSKTYPPVLTCEAVISETCFLLRRIHLIEAVFGMKTRYINLPYGERSVATYAL